MPTVAELSDAYSNFMLNPASPAEERVCPVCLTFTGEGYAYCVSCQHGAHHADVVVPISYSVHFGQLHTALRKYKRDPVEMVARRFEIELAAVLWRFLAVHEVCVARAAGVERFDVVTVVPSGDAVRDLHHPLRRIIGDTVRVTSDRYLLALERSSHDVDPRIVDARKYAVTEEIAGSSCLLVDDTWTTGASVQSAAGALKAAGAPAVGVVAIGRHIHDDWGDNEARLRALPRPFDWSRCAYETGPA